MSFVITRNVDETGDVSYTETEKTLFSGLLDVALAPLAVLSDSNEYVSKSQAGMGMLGAFAGGIYVGDRFEVPIIGNNY